MSSIKMIVTDLDGTLLRSDKRISPYTQAVFHRCAAQGIVTAVATARYYMGAEESLRIVSPDYAITTDGAMTFQGNRFLWGDSLDLSAANSLIAAVLRMNSTYEITAATDQGVYWNSRQISASPILHKAVYNDYSAPLTGPVYKIVAQLPSPACAEELGKTYGFQAVCYRGEDKYGFTHLNTGKIQAIRRLTDFLHIPLAAVAAFGDDLNDVEMLSACGVGVAVENALPEAKKAAGVVCGSNNIDGVASYIEARLLNRG